MKLLNTIAAIVVVTPIGIIFVCLMLIETLLYLSYKLLSYITTHIINLIKWLIMAIKGSDIDNTINVISSYMDDKLR